MKTLLAALAVSIYVLSVVAPAFAGCPPGTRYTCTQGFNGKVVCSCS